MSDGWAGAEVLHRVGVGILEGRKLSRFYRNITYSKLSTFSFLHDSGSNFFTCDGKIVTFLSCSAVFNGDVPGRWSSLGRRQCRSRRVRSEEQSARPSPPSLLRCSLCLLEYAFWFENFHAFTIVCQCLHLMTHVYTFTLRPPNYYATLCSRTATRGSPPRRSSSGFALEVT